VDRLKALSTGTKLLLGAAALLFFDLFLTWQELTVPFGPQTSVTGSLDGWDFWGLLIGLLTVGVIAAVVVRHTNSQLEVDSRFDLAVLVASSLVLAIALVKNFRDADSAWASYAGVVLAGVMTVGAYLEWARARVEDAALPAPWWQQPGATSGRAAPDPDDARPRW
jgi:hypothetical protein